MSPIAQFVTSKLAMQGLVCDPFLTVALTTSAGSAVDPMASEATWAAWRLSGAVNCPASAELSSGMTLFDRAVEALWVPGRTAWIAEVISPGCATGGCPIIHMASGVLGPSGTTRFESGAMAETIEALLGGPASPYAADTENPAVFFEIGRKELRHSAIIRQRMVTISLPDAELSVLSRWHPTIDPWSGVLRLLAERREATRVRASVLATELSLDDHINLEAALGTLQVLACRPDQRARSRL